MTYMRAKCVQDHNCCSLEPQPITTTRTTTITTTTTTSITTTNTTNTATTTITTSTITRTIITTINFCFEIPRHQYLVRSISAEETKRRTSRLEWNMEKSLSEGQHQLLNSIENL